MGSPQPRMREEPGLLQGQHQQGQHHNLNEDSRQGGDKAGGEEHFKAISRAGHPHKYRVGQAGNDAASQHGGDERGIHVPPELLIKQASEGSIGAQLQHHGRGRGEQGRHLGQQGRKQGRYQPAEGPIGHAAEKTAEQHRQMHGEKLAPRPKQVEHAGQQQADGNAQGGEHQVFRRSFHVETSFRFFMGAFPHIKKPVKQGAASCGFLPYRYFLCISLHRGLVGCAKSRSFS